MRSHAPCRWLPVLLFASTAALTEPGRAATLHVPSQHPTVRAAVDSASSGDTILIAPGVHPGGVHIKNKAVTLASWFVLSGDTSFVAQTVIDSVVGEPCLPGSCAGNAVLEFGTSAGGSSVVGLTIRHGVDGVRAYSRVDIAFCQIVANADGLDYQSGSSGTIRNSLFANNSDDGIDLNGRMSVRVLNNVIRDNHQDGMEVRLYAYTGPTLTLDIVGNWITGNGGDGIQLIDFPDTSSRIIRIEHNLFSTNSDAALGCMPNGITSEDFSGAPIAERVYVINNTFHDEHYGVVGGANLIALNNVFDGVQASALRRVAGNSIVSYCAFWDNGTNFEDSNVDPPHLLFVDPDLNNLGIPRSGSPAIDAGIDSFIWGGETVLALSPADYVGSAPDLGAWEFGRGVPDHNTAPVVNAGVDRTITLPATATLDATVHDDWLPVPGALAVTWSMVAGPEPVTFDDPAAIAARATFTIPGVYVLRLAADDGAMSASDSTWITVLPPPPPGWQAVEARVASDSDDQEETATGTISPNTGDLELVLGPTVQKVGLRFTGVAIPPGAIVTRCYIQFEADEIQSEPTYLLIQGQASDNPGTFTLANFDVSSRPRTIAAVSWAPPPWSLVGEQGMDQRTPDLSSLVQEVINRPAWASGNAMAFIITGSGHRTARSHEGQPSGAALLHVEAISQITGVGDDIAPAFALHRVTPNPSHGPLRVDLSLAAGEPAALELVDLAGRRVAARDLGTLGAGRHSVELRESLPTGVYFVRLAQGGRVRMAKAVVLR